MNIAGRNIKRVMEILLLSSIVLAGTSIIVTAAESYNNDINSIKAPFATLAFIMVFVQLPLGIALYTHTTYDKHAIIRKLHRSVGYILLFVFVFTTALCVANYNIDTYTVQISAGMSHGKTDRYEFKAGVRTITLNTDKIDSNNRRFAFEINGKRVFSKGANWETPASIYGRITNDKYETLVRMAKEANFNAL